MTYNKYAYIISEVSFLVNLQHNCNCIIDISDIIYFFVYYCIGYRRKVVRMNLRNSFPNKSSEELKLIERKFYKTLCDYFVETIKMRTISEAEVKRRMEFVGVDDINEILDYIE